MDRAESLLKVRADSLARVAEKTVENTLGELVLSLLAERASLTREDLADALKARLDSTPSASGKCHPDHDADRQRLLALQRRLDQLPPLSPTAAP